MMLIGKIKIRTIEKLSTALYNSRTYSESFSIDLFDKFWKRGFPRFLLVMSQAFKLFGVQTELSSHLDVLVRKMDFFPRLNPHTIFFRYCL